MHCIARMVSSAAAGVIALSRTPQSAALMMIHEVKRLDMCNSFPSRRGASRPGVRSCSWPRSVPGAGVMVVRQVLNCSSYRLTARLPSVQVVTSRWNWGSSRVVHCTRSPAPAVLTRSASRARVMMISRLMCPPSSGTAPLGGLRWDGALFGLPWMRAINRRRQHLRLRRPDFHPRAILTLGAIDSGPHLIQRAQRPDHGIRALRGRTAHGGAARLIVDGLIPRQLVAFGAHALHVGDIVALLARRLLAVIAIAGARGYPVGGAHLRAITRHPKPAA